jgi:LAO/AO transport system kinase
MTAQTDLPARVVAGDARAVARALRVVDDRPEGYADLLKALWPHAGKAWIVGVTGNPGAGKSTLCDRLIGVLRARGQKVGVLAVDPSSPYTGGAILGDRIRMARHALDDGVFIRSMATRGHLGGLSRSARDAVRVLDAAGYDVVLVETVGVGQDELEITRTAHTTLVVTAPGMGDEVQAIKAGILECADVFAVNKADREGADATARDLELMIALGGETMRSLAGVAGHRTHAAADGHVRATSGAVGEGWTPPILKCTATRGEGVEALVAALDAHRDWLQTTAAGQARWRDRVGQEIRESLREALIDAAVGDLGPEIERAASQVQARSIDPYSATETLVEAFRRSRV